MYRNYHLWPSTKGVYPVQLTDEDYVDFHRQNFMQNGTYKNHFFDYEDRHTKHRTWRDDISTGLAPLIHLMHLICSSMCELKYVEF